MQTPPQSLPAWGESQSHVRAPCPGQSLKILAAAASPLLGRGRRLSLPACHPCGERPHLCVWWSPEQQPVARARRRGPDLGRPSPTQPQSPQLPNGAVSPHLPASSSVYKIGPAQENYCLSHQPWAGGSFYPGAHSMKESVALRGRDSLKATQQETGEAKAGPHPLTPSADRHVLHQVIPGDPGYWGGWWSRTALWELRYPGWGLRPLHVIGWGSVTAQGLAAWQFSSGLVYPWNAPEAWGGSGRRGSTPKAGALAPIGSCFPGDPEPPF